MSLGLEIVEMLGQGNSNFAGTFPPRHILFGTFRLPDHYGIDERSSFPTEIAGQPAHPFRK